jgi:transcriptional regulator with XRE-family HTH domain
MYERSLTQAAVAKLLGISASRMSELMHGKMEPSYQLSRALCLKLNIEPAVVLGV